MSTPNLYDAEPIPQAAQVEVARLLASGDLFRYTSDNSPVTLLEQEFAARIGSRYALAVSSCSAALFLSLKALDLPRGARVLIPAFTFAAVPSAVVHAECRPVLVEVSEDYRIDLDDFAQKLAEGAEAILISHMRGHTSDMDRLLEMAECAGVPVIEDAAHSLGTTWRGRNIGTFGQLGCFSFQSYKMVNAGEGGLLVSDDPDLIARAIVMSGAYEQNWRKHGEIAAHCARWQNRLPLYNMRLNNLSAAIIRPQLDALADRVEAGRRNHDHVAHQLNESPWLHVPTPLEPELRAPDSIQFNLVGFSDSEAAAFVAGTAERGIPVNVFGMSPGNARAFWNWTFLGPIPDLPRTRAMLMRACDLRLPARLARADLDHISGALLLAAADAKEAPRAFGT